EDLSGIIIKLCGEFRWELCKRIQGARWNDLTERSLTSDYVDYIDTYRKNRELSQEAKERVKAAMSKHRNSYKEMFVADYGTYIQYESSGALRHNKVVRFILFNYCPFSKVIREGPIATNPQYTQLIERYNQKMGHEIHLFDMATGRIEKAGFPIPPELVAHRAFLTS
ncbi:MAG: cyclic nucleotide-binding domain-containing protein, partial [Lachnospiraceae bacterium]|nr:cyclic nucleotide-binding domain-containing protein [Lachnospiraceae bacterium]